MADHSPPPRTRSARVTLLVLIVIPLVSLAALWGYVADVTIGNVIRDQHYNTVTSRTGADVSVLSGDLVAERSATLAWLGSGRASASAQAQLKATRQSTDEYVPRVRIDFESVLGVVSPTARKDYQDYFAQVADLSRIRAAVDSGTDSQATAFQAYSTILRYEYQPFLVAVSTSDANVSLMSQAAIAETRATDFSAGALALIQGALAAHGAMSQPARELFAEVVGQQNLEVDNTYSLATTPALTAILDDIYATPAFHQLQAIETQVENSPPGRPIPVSSAAVRPLLTQMAAADQTSGERLGVLLSAASAQLSNSLQTQLYLAGGLGLVAVALSVTVMVRFGRSLERELRDLYNSARQIADERLPRLVAQLRRGEEVHPESESPPMPTGRITEIVDVAQAFSRVQRTAVEAAVGQAALRKGVNKVFVSMSLRSQSLLHRQLSMLDEMERAATDPAALADLFLLDHLTTRMRRHAEGLLIVAGSTPGRGWRDPVPVADVLQAAVAEIEDYVRVDVVAESADAVAGPAVNDVIHLIAELVENATQFSPPNTRVTVTGDMVARGYAVEIEDRGLGLAPEAMAAFNQRLADPPEFDLANTDQLGLFVAARLAQRQRIRVSLRMSPYGGTTAVVVLPRDIIVPENTVDALLEPGADGQRPTPAGSRDFLEAGRTGYLGANGAPAGVTGRHRGPSHSTEAPSAVAAPWFPELPPLAPVPRRGAEATGAHPARSPRAAQAGLQPGPGRPSTANMPDAPDRPAGPGAPGGSGTGSAFAGTSHKGMPRRVKQANLAPQLRTGNGTGPAVPPSAGPDGPGHSPEQMNRMLSALQAGWQRGRLDDLEPPGAGQEEPFDGRGRYSGAAEPTDREV